MPVSTLVITPGAANANAYVSRLAADQFHLDHPPFGTTAVTGLWSTATNDEKDSSILWATKLLDRLYEWNGWVVDDIQVLLWPRLGLYRPNSIYVLDSTTIPNEIQWATAELARQLLMSNRTADSDIESQGIKLIKVGSVRIDFKDAVFAKPIPDIVTNLIPEEWGYVLQNEKINIRELRRA